MNLTDRQNSGCISLTSENGLFQRVFHDDGKGNFSIEMDRKPTVLPYLADKDDLGFNEDTDQSGSPFKASLIFDMEQNKINLGNVRNKDFKVLRTAKMLGNSRFISYDTIGKLKLSETGKFEVFDINDRKLDMSTNFIGKSYFDFDVIQVLLDSSIAYHFPLIPNMYQ